MCSVVFPIVLSVPRPVSVTAVTLYVNKYQLGILGPFPPNTRNLGFFYFF